MDGGRTEVEAHKKTSAERKEAGAEVVVNTATGRVEAEVEAGAVKSEVHPSVSTGQQQNVLRVPADADCLPGRILVLPNAVECNVALTMKTQPKEQGS